MWKREKLIYIDYFIVSLPEWYHPDYHDNTFLWWHGPPHNPFTGQEIEYRKSKRVADFVNEIQVPQALELIHQYEPDIFWQVNSKTHRMAMHNVNSLPLGAILEGSITLRHGRLNSLVGLRAEAGKW